MQEPKQFLYDFLVSHVAVLKNLSGVKSGFPLLTWTVLLRLQSKFQDDFPFTMILIIFKLYLHCIYPLIRKKPLNRLIMRTFTWFIWWHIYTSVFCIAVYITSLPILAVVDKICFGRYIVVLDKQVSVCSCLYKVNVSRKLSFYFDLVSINISVVFKNITKTIQLYFSWKLEDTMRLVVNAVTSFISIFLQG